MREISRNVLVELSELDFLEQTEPFIVVIAVVVAEGTVADGSIPYSDPDHVATRLHG